MKKFKVVILTLCAGIVMTGCNTLAKGTAIGAVGGAALGAVVGKLAGNTAVGAAVGAGTGALIGKHMDKKKAALEAQLAQAADVETITDANGLTAIKVTFNADMTFATGKAVLSSTAKSALQKFAAQMTDADMINTDILIKGHTDNTGSAAVNEKLSLQRAEAVSKVLKSNGIASARLSEEGCSYNEPVADNSTAAGRKQNRRVEVYVLATQAMVDQYTNDSSL